MNLAIIPARGGSKRIPRKNIKDFCGKPILSYSVEVALKSKLFDEVMVSTDDAEIAAIAKQYGAKVPFLRSAKTSNDFATTNEVLVEVLESYRAIGKQYDYLCCIYPTAPLINEQDLIQGFGKLTNHPEINIVFPGLKFSYPIWRGLEVDKEGKAKMLWPENALKRSQDLKLVYHDAGSWYWMRINEEIKIAKPYEKSILVEVEESRIQDIDNLEDWKIAEMKYKILHGL